MLVSRVMEEKSLPAQERHKVSNRRTLASELPPGMGRRIDNKGGHREEVPTARRLGGAVVICSD